MQSFVIDTSVSDFVPERRLYRLRVKSLTVAKSVLDYAAADLYSEICYRLDGLGDWVKVEAPISAVAQLQVAGLVDVQVEG